MGTVAVGEILLPKSPEYVLGETCTQEDKASRLNSNHLVERFYNLIRSEEFKQPGWKIAVRTYEMSKPSGTDEGAEKDGQPEQTQAAGFGYNTLELIAPDGSTFASLNALHIDRKTGIIQDRNINIESGTISTFVDDCAAGNEIAIPENKKAETVLLTGKGSDALFMFAKSAEAAKEVAVANFNYSPDNPDLHKFQVNQNTLTRAYAEVITGRDETVLEIIKNAKDAGIESPGLDIDLFRGKPSQYSHENGDDFVSDVNAVFHFFDELRILQPTTLQTVAVANGIKEELRQQMQEQQNTPPANAI